MGSFLKYKFKDGGSVSNHNFPLFVIGILLLFKCPDQRVETAPILTGDPKQKQKLFTKNKKRNKKLVLSIKGLMLENSRRKMSNSQN